MFDIAEFMSAPVVEEITTVKRGNEEFTIRRLNGAERMKFNDIHGQYERTLYVLSRALLSGENKTPIGEQNAAKFIERFGTLAEGLFTDIFELTQKTLEQETEIWTLAKKNTASQETTKD